MSVTPVSVRVSCSVDICDYVNVLQTHRAMLWGIGSNLDCECCLLSAEKKHSSSIQIHVHGSI